MYKNNVNVIFKMLIEIEEAFSVAYVLYNEYYIYDLLDSYYEHDSEFVEAYDKYFRRLITSYQPVYTSIQNIKIYVNNPFVLHSGGVAFISDEVRAQQWFKDYENQIEEEPVLIRAPIEDVLTNRNSHMTFSLVRKLDFFTSLNKWEKVLKIEIRPAILSQTLTSLNVPGHVYLVNAKNAIEYTTDSSIAWQAGPLPFDQLDISSNYVKFESSVYDGYPMRNWKIVALVPESEVFFELKSSLHLVLGIAFINLIIASIATIIVSRSITTRLARILRHMKRVKNQNFDMIDKIEAKDEIGQLSEEFNRMTSQISSLINDVYVADIKEKNMEIEHRHAQLNALQSQINPHFLFNALETIRMRSSIKKETETAKIILNMAKLFRSSLTWKRDKVPVTEELEFINCFLEIQKYRFADRLDYRIEIDEEAKHCLIPKLIFLPFVENACIHGIEKVRHGGEVNIKFNVINDQLIFSITDNGSGMNNEKVNQIKSYLVNGDQIGERIGVQNVIYRLKLIYKHQFEFVIHSKEGEGTSIHITLPAQYSET